MPCLESCYFQEIFDIKSSVKLTLFTFNKVLFVRNTCPTISSLYYKVIKRISKTTLLKVDINRKESIKSV